MEAYLVYPTEEQALEAFFEAFEVSFEKRSKDPLPAHVIEGIKEGQEDYKAGRTISMDEFKKKLLMYK